MRARRQQGMTLIEIMVAMSILAILSVMGYKAFSSLLTAREHLMGTAEEWINLSRTFHRIELDLQRATLDPAEAATSFPMLGGPVGAPLVLTKGNDGAQILSIFVFTNQTPSGKARIVYRVLPKRNGMQWGFEAPWPSMQGKPTGFGSDLSKIKLYNLPAEQFAFRFQLMLSDGRRVDSWSQNNSDRMLPVALIGIAKSKKNEQILRIWSLPS